ncbi:MAG: tRNA (N6-isopentenyl adenosine(37)-C2)-methylthiotransferase MiaB [Bacillota bacterium]|nr:tRNA (N6-isopentenyl adenosine(37)-C2)-methylthiotransferase MiaB [Bacillota bacterium]
MIPLKIDEKEIIRQKEIMDKVKTKNPAGLLCKIVTLGCQQNESDSEKLAGMLTKMGYGFTEDSENASLILFNTCAVRENAEKKLFGKIGALKLLKEKNPDLLIGVCGCLPQQKVMEEKFKKSYKFVDIVFGTHSLYRFPEILYKAISDHKAVRDIADIEGEVSEGIPTLRSNGIKAYVSIMYGCNNFCSYCVVPYVRGRERSRDYRDILQEINELSKSGYKEVMLLGQNVNSYSGGLDFANLLKKVSDIEDIERIRFMTSHPKDLSDEVIDIMAERENICNQLHLPVQSGSDRMLEKMNRRYDIEHYMGIVNKLKSKIPDVALSTDIIVGFPGETMEDFEKTMELLKKVRYDTIYSFIYSRRYGTPAYDMPDVMSEEDKHKNFERMLELQNSISLEKNKALVGTVQTVLVEGLSKTNKLMQSGRNEGGKLVHFKGTNDLVGKFVSVKITEVNTWTLTGELI